MSNLTHATDELTTMVNEIFRERGYEATVSLGNAVSGKMGFQISAKPDAGLTTEIVNGVVEEAVRRLDLAGFECRPGKPEEFEDYKSGQ